MPSALCPKETALALHDVYNQVRVVAALQDKKLPAWRSKDNPMMEILHTEGMADFEEVLHEEGILDNEIEALQLPPSLCRTHPMCPTLAPRHAASHRLTSP